MSDSSLVHQQMVKVMKAVTPIAKESSQGVKYKFRSIDQLFDVVHAIFAEHGLFLSPRVLDDWSVIPIPGTPDHKGNPRTQYQATFRLCVDVYAEDGSMVTLGPGLAQAHDYGDKSVYQGQQNSFKYVLIEALTIPTGEQDMDGREPDPVPQTANQAQKKASEDNKATDGQMRKLWALGNSYPRPKEYEDNVAGWLDKMALTVIGKPSHKDVTNPEASKLIDVIEDAKKAKEAEPQGAA